jgi:hypothetical protein
MCVLRIHVLTTGMEQLADKKFRREFLRKAVANMIAGDLETAKSVLREYINGTVGFVALG